MNDGDTDVSPIEGIDGTVPAPAGKQERRRVVLLVGAVVLVVVAGGAAYVTRHKPTKPHTLTGTLVLSDSGAGEDICNPTDDYSDVSDGAQVVVRDADDKIIAQGNLDRGTADTAPFNPSSGSGRTGQTYKVCRHAFTVVVPEIGFYRITIGRRAIPYTKADLKAKNWSINLNLDAPPPGAG
jgi:hypothetical protein